MSSMKPVWDEQGEYQGAPSSMTIPSAFDSPCARATNPQPKEVPGLHTEVTVFVFQLWPTIFHGSWVYHDKGQKA